MPLLVAKADHASTLCDMDGARRRWLQRVSVLHGLGSLRIDIGSEHEKGPADSRRRGQSTAGNRRLRSTAGATSHRRRHHNDDLNPLVPAKVVRMRQHDYCPVDFAHTATTGLFAAPLVPRHVADLSLGKLVGFLAAPHQAFTRTSSASHCTVQPVASQAERANRTPAGPGGPLPSGRAWRPRIAFRSLLERSHTHPKRELQRRSMSGRGFSYAFLKSDRPAHLR